MASAYDGDNSSFWIAICALLIALLCNLSTMTSLRRENAELKKTVTELKAELRGGPRGK